MNKLVGLTVVALLGVAIAAHAPVPAAQPLGPQLGRHPPGIKSADRLSPWIGRWNVEFANGIQQVHELRNDYTATVKSDTLNWSSRGRIERDGKSVTITYRDDRVERWTPVGDRMVVEHWYPASRLPITAPVLGIGERAK
jgi:hypothetical protein